MGIYVTDEDPVKFNKTKALSGCRNNSYFPDIYKHKGTALSTAGLDPLILYIIIGASALVVVIIIIVVSGNVFINCGYAEGYFVA